jgi:hypothetical protein
MQCEIVGAHSRFTCIVPRRVCLSTRQSIVRARSILNRALGGLAKQFTWAGMRVSPYCGLGKKPDIQRT